MNVCVGCGISTEADTCPAGCKSTQDPNEPKPTIPWALIPAKCWDCGNPITLPPHQRTALGQCEPCAFKSLAREN